MTENPAIADLRRDYTLAGLRRADLDADPIAQFNRWFQQALAAGVTEPNAMSLATADKEGRPSARIVLLKVVDGRGFGFFTNYDSRKGRELADNPHAALVFHWQPLERQVGIYGTVGRMSPEESVAYFNSRPKGSRLAALVSHQSEVVANREVLEKQWEELSAAYPGDNVPMPPYWGGFLVRPERVEFWQGRPSRLHDRFRYTRTDGDAWRIERLSP